MKWKEMRNSLDMRRKRTTNFPVTPNIPRGKHGFLSLDATSIGLTLASAVCAIGLVVALSSPHTFTSPRSVVDVAHAAATLVPDLKLKDEGTDDNKASLADASAPLGASENSPTTATETLADDAAVPVVPQPTPSSSATQGSTSRQQRNGTRHPSSTKNGDHSSDTSRSTSTPAPNHDEVSPLSPPVSSPPPSPPTLSSPNTPPNTPTAPDKTGPSTPLVATTPPPNPPATSASPPAPAPLTHTSPLAPSPPPAPIVSPDVAATLSSTPEDPAAQIAVAASTGTQRYFVRQISVLWDATSATPEVHNFAQPSADACAANNTTTIRSQHIYPDAGRHSITVVASFGSCGTDAPQTVVRNLTVQTTAVPVTTPAKTDNVPRAFIVQA